MRTLGQYELFEEIGRGGMAVVFRGRDTQTGQEVAVKLLAQHLLGYPAFLARFQREIKTMKRLNHPHIAAMLLLIIVIVPQFLFAGALLSLDSIPGGPIISVVIEARWTFEAFARETGMGDKLAADACWRVPKSERQHWTEAQKAGCACLGSNIFTRCAGFPGILSPDAYDAAARCALAQPAPTQPVQPTRLPTPSPLPTPTPLPSLVPLSPPPNPRAVNDFVAQSQTQSEQYFKARLAQLADYNDAGQSQLQAYLDDLKAQGDEYSEAVSRYGDERSEWEKNRQKAIGSAEGTHDFVNTKYRRAFRGTVAGRWGALLAIMAGLLAIILIFQKLKDEV